MNKLIASILVLFLAGCGTPEQIPGPTVTVKVPVVAKCETTVKVTDIGELPTKKLRKDMTLYQKAQLFISENELLKGQNKELKAALAECTK
jgi:hypothetical protein